jgi:predicted nucleic acid-binding protein
MKFLVDTNIWLELLLGQEKSEIVSLFLEQVSLDDLFVSDFAIHSIGVILSKKKKADVFSEFLEDLFVNGQITQLSLNPVELHQVAANILEFKLDFDDGYQLAVSQKYDLTIVTFDKDFNAKGIRKITPEEFIQQYNSTKPDLDIPY